jgi:hypothetical protein
MVAVGSFEAVVQFALSVMMDNRANVTLHYIVSLIVANLRSWLANMLINHQMSLTAKARPRDFQRLCTTTLEPHRVACTTDSTIISPRPRPISTHHCHSTCQPSVQPHGKRHKSTRNDLPKAKQPYEMMRSRLSATNLSNVTIHTRHGS